MAKKHRFGNFYMQLACVNLLFFLTALLCLTAYTGSLAQSYERNNQLKRYDTALAMLYTTFNEKQSTFSNTLAYLLRTGQSREAVHALLESADHDQLPVQTRAQVTSTLSALCSSDSDIVGVLLRNAQTGVLYSYQTQSQIIGALEADGDFPDYTQYSRYIVVPEELLNMSSGLAQMHANHIYGLMGYLSFSNEEEEAPLQGQVIVLYSPSHISRSYSSYGLDHEARFTIRNSAGLTVYDSTGDYTAGLMEDGQTQECYHASVANADYDYQVSYEIPKAFLNAQSLYVLQFIVLVAAGATVVTAITYYVFYRLSSRRIQKIDEGMARFGLDNLDYRIAPMERGNELNGIIHSFNTMCDNLQSSIHRNYTYVLEQKNAELYALQTSINPHFLCNTLESIRARVSRDGDSDAAHMLVLLSKLYRGQIKGSLFTSILDELTRCDLFIDLYQCRFENFVCLVSVPAEFYSFALPRNTLQPIIENYFEHGIHTDRDDNRIQISAQWARRGDQRLIRLSVRNNGRTPSADTLDQLKSALAGTALGTPTGNGFGLVNVDRRLRIIFGDDYGLAVSAVEDGGFLTEILIPPYKPEDLETAHHTPVVQKESTNV